MTPSILKARSVYLVGIKGVAMAALAACLSDAGVEIRGCDVAEEFVTSDQLHDLATPIDIGFDHELSTDVEMVVYTAAHQGIHNPLVQKALAKGIPCISHAEALGALFNEKAGIAVCGVGGKTTTSAMVAWILNTYAEQLPSPDLKPSYAVGVGKILGMERTGQWSPESTFFVAEADEYVVDPSAPSRGEAIVPRFSYLQPQIIICTNLKYDHPDVYSSFEATKAAYKNFFLQLKQQGTLILNGDDQELVALGQAVAQERTDIKIMTFGYSPQLTATISDYRPTSGSTQAEISVQSDKQQLVVALPGKFNMANAVSAVLAASVAEVPLMNATELMRNFQSTQRRSESKGTHFGVAFYDDYAHHPSEVSQVIAAFREWYPQSRLVVAFQSHTFSRTKALFAEFVTAFDQASEVVMIDIFPSAREAWDESVSSDMLCEAITAHNPQIKARNLKTIPALATWLKQNLQPGDVCLTLGAGDIYHVHEVLQAETESVT